MSRACLPMLTTAAVALLLVALPGTPQARIIHQENSLYSNIVSGSSMRPLKTASNWAPRAPSTTR